MYKLLLVTVLAAAIASTSAAYDTKYDNVDVDALILDDNRFNGFVNCIVGRGPCTEPAQAFKDNLPEVLRTICAECNEQQRSIFEKVLHGLKAKYPAELESLHRQYSPTVTIDSGSVLRGQ